VDDGEANFILEIDLASYFDSINREKLLEVLQKRVADGSIPSTGQQMHACGGDGRRGTEFGLKLNADKTRLLDFRSPRRSQGEGKGRGTFDFLGFTWYWRRTRRGRWTVACKTRRARLTRAIRAAYDWCRGHLHQPVKEQHAALTRRIQGHINYFGVSGNIRSLTAVVYSARRAWFKWLNRRSQRARLTWERFEDLLRDFPLPEPRIVVNIWKGAR
jgi:hypothetical protein